MNKNYPKHIALILDGNRRWAKERGLPSFEGHRAGFLKIKKLFDWILDLDIKETTLYCFSIQNFKRTKDEVKYLMNIFTEAFKDVIDDLKVHKNKVRVRVIGERYLLPPNLLKAVENAEKTTKKYSKYFVNFALGYGGQEEIVEAVKKISESVKKGLIKISDINVDTIKDNLYLSSYPDIIIRTSGEVRTSNFLTFQQAYSEWFFLSKYWPDFEKSDLKNIIKEYQERERRFGK